MGLRVWEGDGLLVGLPGGQAVVQAAEEAVEQVALRGGVVVTGVSAAVVVSAGAGRGGQCGERPAVACVGESVVFDPPVHHRDRLAAGTGHGCRAGVGLKRAGVGEAGSVVADLGQHAGAGERTEPGLAGDDRRVGVSLELLDDGGGELVGVGAGRVEPAQRERLTAEGTLDQRGLVQVLGAQYRLESVGFGVDAARAAGRVVATSAAGS